MTIDHILYLFNEIYYKMYLYLYIIYSYIFITFLLLLQ